MRGKEEFEPLALAEMASSQGIQPAKLVLLGDMGAGKSSLVLRFVKGQFTDYQVRARFLLSLLLFARPRRARLPLARTTRLTPSLAPPLMWSWSLLGPMLLVFDCVY